MKNAIIAGVMAGTVLITGCGQRSSTYPGDWIWKADSQSLDRVPSIFLLRPSTLPANHAPFDMMGKDRYLARGKTLEELIDRVWSQKNSALIIKFDADLPKGTFDFIAADQPRWWDKLQTEIDERFHIVERVNGNEVVVSNSGTQ
jgi:hypothetical protein